MLFNAHQAMDVFLTSVFVMINASRVLKEAMLLSELPNVPWVIQSSGGY
jgi:hypothetical protein